MTTLYCADCGRRLEPDDDHVWIDAEVKQIDDRNDREEFAFCMDCWIDKDWNDPA
jgi:hypothetical protein